MLMPYIRSLTAAFSKVLCMVVFTLSANAQVEESSDLFLALAEKDNILFEQGFNECNLTATESLVSEDLEFYHDVSGLQDKELFQSYS